MSVLACDRYDCENIMCDRLILDGTEYICNDCFQELLDYKKSWPKEMSKADVRTRLEDFMRTKVGAYSGPCDVEEEFKRLTSR